VNGVVLGYLIFIIIYQCKFSKHKKQWNTVHKPLLKISPIVDDSSIVEHSSPAV
jgi:hypothetical protein